MNRPAAPSPGRRALAAAAPWALLLACWSAAAQPPAEPAEAEEAPASFREAFEAGTFHLGLRYRFEQVADDAFADDAEASTLRTTLSYRTGAWRGWSLFLEAEDVSPIFDDGAGDGERAFATPLATLHKWNGWADRFLQTPAVGLETVYLTARGPLGPLSWTVVYLDFTADEGDLDLGSEVDAQLSYGASWGQTFALKLADYAAGDVSTDSRKVMLWSTYTF